jgi:hypothetical protein
MRNAFTSGDFSPGLRDRAALGFLVDPVKNGRWVSHESSYSPNTIS